MPRLGSGVRIASPAPNSPLRAERNGGLRAAFFLWARPLWAESNDATLEGPEGQRRQGSLDSLDIQQLVVDVFAHILIRRNVEFDQQVMLASLMDMDVTTYRYKQEHGGDGTTKVGFIAEEMPKEVLSKDGKGVDLYELITYNIAATQVQQQDIGQIKGLKAENQTLQAQVDALQAQNDALRELVCQDHPTAALCL